MRALAKILAVSLLLFLAISIAQEHRTFLAFLSPEVERAPELTDSDREEIEEVVHETLTLLAHLYSSGGDPRFVERMPIAAGVREELETDLAYLRRNHRRQSMLLQKVELGEYQAAGPDRVRVTSREWWIVRFLSLVTEHETDPPWIGRLDRVFRLSRESGSWLVGDWELAETAGER